VRQHQHQGGTQARQGLVGRRLRLCRQRKRRWPRKGACAPTPFHVQRASVRFACAVLFLSQCQCSPLLYTHSLTFALACRFEHSVARAEAIRRARQQLDAGAITQAEFDHIVNVSRGVHLSRLNVPAGLEHVGVPRSESDESRASHPSTRDSCESTRTSVASTRTSYESSRASESPLA
jgi:hypothetical protein